VKVILLKDAKNLGKKDQVVEVSDGYANNYLIPNKIASNASSENIIGLHQNQAYQAKLEAQKEQDARKLKEELKTIRLVFKVKVGTSGKLFGSVTSKQILFKLNTEHQINLDKHQVLNGDVINTLGPSIVEVELYKGVKGVINVVLEAEQE
jgi:large subunit ribosomal protein L9